jgi:pimeloyl-ACP methyl ester carboxylesterase
MSAQDRSHVLMAEHAVRREVCASPWVLLRGLTRERGHWGAFPAELARAMPGATVVTVDLPGAGVLRHERCPLRVESMVEACRRQLTAAGVQPPYALMGLSMGGMVAAAWMRAHPQEVACGVLVNTSMRPYSPPQRRLQWRQLPQLMRLLASTDATAAERAILALTSAWPERHGEVVEAWQALRLMRPVTRANALRQLLAAARYSWTGPPPAPPVLVASSVADGLVDPACSQSIARAWGADWVSHAAAGHDLPLDDGPWLAARIAEWLG